ncbi:sensor domain-containing diguanylate cyclase [Vreelandella janggokensis]|uniref:sensor domain-containing diguanylate cyclase n=1 Tax=Vreelandella janggokensis TaxID=370767 RepID=UPI002861E281|nr:diguanylate cyclase [Halomonas janggokensis]MDR5885450.1 diguanylate cyclase [Halomonas janggokensis]
MHRHIPRSLRFRFFAALGGLLICAIVALAAISSSVIFPALQAEERQAVKRELDRVERSFQLEQQQLLAQVRDWAHWDDTYQFVQGDYPRYKDVNFSQEMFDDMRYQLMAFFNNAGEVYFLAGINPTTGNYQTCETPNDECAWMEPWVKRMQSAIDGDRADQSAIYADQEPVMVGSTPILRTDKSGSPAGWLFKTRALDDEWLSFMEEYTGLPINLSLTRQAASSSDALSFSGNIVHAERYLPIYSPLTPVSLGIGIELNRTSYLTSLTTFRYVLLWTAVLMILVIAVVLLLLEKIVLKPLRLLTQFTQQLDIHETDVHKLTRRSDEIGLLSRAFQEQFTCQQQLNDELLKMSTHDALTGLPNRRLFDQQLETAFSDTSTDSDSVAVMMLDIDHFKLYNDHYGHPEGDVCLQRIADAMYSLARTRDFFIARTGGEEFCALLPHISPDKARGIGEQLLAAIDGLQIPHSTSPVKPFVTISVGIAMQKDAKSQSPSAVVSCADQALYLAKEAGRHQVAFFSPQLASGLTPEHNAPQ